MTTSVSVAPPRGAGSVHFDAPPPLSLYVHVPWCVRKCPYCDFNSHEARGEVPEARYVDALIADLEHALPQVYGREVETVFFGGGTPSLFSPEAIDRFLCAARARLPIRPDAEITLEANPGTFEQAKFAAFRACGVNRLSIGVQSFDARHLKALGRVHDAAEAHRAVEIAQRCFDNFNLDLMYALPGQTADEAAADVATAIATGAPHLSLYHLTLEPNTLFHARPPAGLPDDDAAAAMQDAIDAALAAAGYRHYETSAFARPGRACRHNLGYWTFGDYLGIGAGAHGKVSLRERIVREMRWKHPREYVDRTLAGEPVQTRNDVTVAELPFEFLMNALRLVDGVEVGLFAARCGVAMPRAMRTQLDAAEARGLLVRDHVRMAPTALGRRFLNDLLELFLDA
jgi:oxygen-independent coproporphyrinogen-3 oxidase